MEVTTTRTEAGPKIAPGTHGSLRLRFSKRSGRTVLWERHVRAPFGSVRLSRTEDGDLPEVQITNPSGGVLGGDRLDVRIDLGSETSATILTQGATKLYRGTHSEQDARVCVGEGAFLEYLPHHTIPYAGSGIRQRTVFDLAPSAALISWEALSAGRLARGERFEFDRITARTEVWRDSRPLALDGMDVIPLSHHEPFAGFSYYAVAFVCAPTDLRPLAAKLQMILQELPGELLVSASAPEERLCVVRILSQRGPDLYRALNLSRAVARNSLGLPAPGREIH